MWRQVYMSRFFGAAYTWHSNMSWWFFSIYSRRHTAMASSFSSCSMSLVIFRCSESFTAAASDNPFNNRWKKSESFSSLMVVVLLRDIAESSVVTLRQGCGSCASPKYRRWAFKSPMHSVPLLLQLTVELVYQFHRVQLVAEQQFFCKTSTLELVHDGVYHLFQALVSDQGCFPIFREVHGFGFYLLGKLHSNRVLCGLGIYRTKKGFFPGFADPTSQWNRRNANPRELPDLGERRKSGIHWCKHRPSFAWDLPRITMVLQPSFIAAEMLIELYTSHSWHYCIQ